MKQKCFENEVKMYTATIQIGYFKATSDCDGLFIN